MRWFHIDRFEVLEKNRYARAVKCVTMAEEHLHDHFPGFPVVPAALNIESMAQTAGVLAGYTYDFQKNVILAKVEKAVFPRLVRPGDRMIIEAWIDEIKPEGCWTHAKISVEGDEVASAGIIFVHLEDVLPESFVFTEGFMDLLRTSGVL
jgi:3-hydroxyacyl-[acyl-carrier-protein] dehydratase